jgi:hypothetical protein
MAWTIPQHTKGEIQRAGRAIVDEDADFNERRAAVAIVNNWRSAHGFPLNTLQVSLRKRAQKVDPEALVAQRIKRLPSIIGKLERFPKMNVSRMQDLGGCRAVLVDVPSVYEVVDSFLTAQHKHKLVRQDDYIQSPKASGYRGVHMVYAYRSDKTETWNGLSIEVQIRSLLQHAWATAVETVGLFTNQALKSSVGETDWLRFFQVMSSMIAINEGQPTLAETSSDVRELKVELKDLAKKLNVVERLESYAQLLQQSEEHMARARFVILTLQIEEQRLTIRGYRKQDDAAAAYAEQEALSGDGVDVVLVAVSSIAGLRSAYPNYFLDTTRFVKVLREALH